MKRILITFLLIGLLVPIVQAKNIKVDFFFSPYCPHCAKMKEIFSKYEDNYELLINYQNVYADPVTRERFLEYYDKFGVEKIRAGVPTIILDNKTCIIGEIPEEKLVAILEECKAACPKEIVTYYTTTPIEPKSKPIALIAIWLGLMDGLFNPCALSVILFLFAYLIGLGAKKRILKAGITYSLVIFIVYFLFTFGILKLFQMLGFVSKLSLLIGIFIIIIGIIQLKDFFFYGKGITLEIPKSAKPTIEKLIKAATLPSIVLLAFFVSLVEIPCAGGFPVAFAEILRKETVSTILRIAYLALYNLFFVLPLVLLTLIFYFGLMKVEKAERLRRKLRKYMRLVSGIVLIGLGIWILGGI